uniref:CREST protein n=1 Tax=Anisakis simplex TaxID=6269 RepID=A0A0M3J4X6_ANISI
LRPQMSQTNAQTGLTMPQPQTLSVQQSISNQPESQLIYTQPQSAASILEPSQQYPQSQLETVYARSGVTQNIPQPETIISQRQVTSVGSQPQSELSMPQQSQIISAEQLQSQHPSILSYAPERQPMEYSGSIQQPQQQQQMQIQAPTIQEYSNSQFVHAGAGSVQQAEIKCPPGSCPQAPCPCGNNRISEQESQSLQRNQQLNQQQYQYQQQAPTQLSVSSISPQQGQSSPQIEVLQSIGSQSTSTSFASQQCQQTCQMSKLF